MMGDFLGPKQGFVLSPHHHPKRACRRKVVRCSLTPDPL